MNPCFEGKTMKYLCFTLDFGIFYKDLLNVPGGNQRSCEMSLSFLPLKGFFDRRSC